MSTLTPSRLKEVRNAETFRQLTADNFAILADEIAKRVATYQNGSPTTIIGPPTGGDRVLNEFWRDALGGEWVCTDAGAPGTWQQIRPPAVAVDPATGTIPTGYMVWNVTDGAVKRHAGAYSWEITVGADANGKVGFHGVTPTTQAAHIPDPSGGTTVDAESKECPENPDWGDLELSRNSACSLAVRAGFAASLLLAAVWQAGAVEPSAPPLLEAQMYAGITVTGTVGNTYVIQATTDLDNANAWVTIANIVLPASPWLFIDRDSPELGDRFYRAVEVPPDTVEPLALVFEPPPFDLRDAEASFARDVAYGPHRENVFDIFLAHSAKPTPLVVFIHGGGFQQGDKGVVYVTSGFRQEIRECLTGGASYATINYRLLQWVNEEEGVIKSLNDCKRCLQFLRHHSAELNVDPSRVGLYGTSAGAGSSLWLGFNDELADPLADDPVLRESTRVRAIGAKAPQATYDLTRWPEDVFGSLDLTAEQMDGILDPSGDGLVKFYGIDSTAELQTPEMQAYLASVDMLALMSPDDPPFWVMNTVENTGVPTDKGELLHHSLHSVALLERAGEVGVECQPYIIYQDIIDPAGEGVIEFLLSRLGE